MFNVFSGKNSRLSTAGIYKAADHIQVTPRDLRTIITVEAAASGYQKNGLLKALFEPHRMYAELTGQPAKLQRAIAAGLAYKNWGEKPYPKDSYARIRAAMAIDETAALRATSWGLPQILGSNYRMAGYSTPQAMVAAMADSEDVQVMCMSRFLSAAGLARALRAHNWDVVAAGYNGKKYRVGGYQLKLAKAYARLPDEVGTAKTLPPSPVDPVITDDPELHTADDAPETPANGTPAAAPVAPPVDTAKVLFVQQRLRELGYLGVGTPDGDAPSAGWTEAAILDYRNSYNAANPDKPPLDLVPAIDDALILALPSGPPKAVPPARADVTTADLKPTSGIIQKAGQNKVVAWILGVPAAIVGAVNGVISNLGDAKSYLAPIQDLVTSIPAWGWATGVVAVAGGLWWNSHRIEQDRVNMTKTGKAL